MLKSQQNSPGLQPLRSGPPLLIVRSLHIPPQRPSDRITQEPYVVRRMGWEANAASDGDQARCNLEQLEYIPLSDLRSTFVPRED